jgi:hypothetical protein
LTKKPKTFIGEETASSTNSAGKTGYVHAKDEARLLSFILYKNQLKMDQNPNVKSETLKLLWE